jgi:hypothetical protein
LNLVVGIYAVAALASSLAAVLAWASKLWWAKEYAAAKDETIQAKEAQIELLKTEVQNLRDLTPMKLREYFLSVKEQLEEYNDELREELEAARKEIQKKESELQQMLGKYPGLFPGGPTDPSNAKAEAWFQDLMTTKGNLQKKAYSLEQKLLKEEELRHTLEGLLSRWSDSRKEASS